MNGFIVHVEGLVSAADKEISGCSLATRSIWRWWSVYRFPSSAQSRNLGTDDKGKYKTLERETVAFSVRRGPATVAITDESAMPSEFKSITVTMPALKWEAMLDALDIEMRSNILDDVKRLDSTVSKALVKSAIEAAVPNCQKLLKGENALPVITESVPGAAWSWAACRWCESNIIRCRTSHRFAAYAVGAQRSESSVIG